MSAPEHGPTARPRRHRACRRSAATTSRGCAAATSARCRPCSAWSCWSLVFSALRPDDVHQRLQLRQPDQPVGGGHRHRDGPGLRAAARRDRPVGRLHRRQRRRGHGHRDDPQRAALVPSRSWSAWPPARSSASSSALLVARLGIPSFVVTLAAFLALQGVMLLLIGEGGTIPYRNETDPRDHEREPPDLARVDPRRRGPRRLRRRTRCRAAAARRGGRPGCTASRCCCGPSRSSSLAAITLGATAYLSAERSRNPQLSSLKGIPVVVVVLLVLLVVADLPAQPHRLGPPRLRRRRQRRGRAPRRHQRGADQADLLHHLLLDGRDRRHPAGQPHQLRLALAPAAR